MVDPSLPSPMPSAPSLEQLLLLLLERDAALVERDALIGAGWARRRAGSQPGKNSRNSSKPPSSDGFVQPATTWRDIRTAISGQVHAGGERTHTGSEQAGCPCDHARRRRCITAAARGSAALSAVEEPHYLLSCSRDMTVHLAQQQPAGNRFVVSTIES